VSDNEFVYRVTYANGDLSATCSRRSLAGKIGYSNEGVRRQRDHGSYAWPGNIIVKIERAPLEAWTDVTEEFTRLEKYDG
jgi:hypothetical protein